MDLYGNRRFYQDYSSIFSPFYNASGYPTRPEVLVDSNQRYAAPLRRQHSPLHFPGYTADSKPQIQPDVPNRNSTGKALKITFAAITLWAVAATVLAIVYVIKYDQTSCPPCPEVTTVAPPSTVDINADPSELVRGTLTFDNLLYDESLQDRTSPLFLFYKDSICAEIMESIADNFTTKGCDITRMSQGSLVVTWAIGLDLATVVHPEEMMTVLESALRNRLQTSSKFHGRVGRVYMDACALDEDGNRPCEQLCVVNNQTGQIQCQCEEGFTLNDDGKTCRDIDECLTASCPDKCENTEGSYRCICPDAYEQADNGINCTEKAPTTDCTCPDGYEESENGTCVDVDECTSSPCEEACVNTLGSYFCNCRPERLLVYGTNGTHCADAELHMAVEDPYDLLLGQPLEMFCTLKTTGYPVEGFQLRLYKDGKPVLEEFSARILLDVTITPSSPIRLQFFLNESIISDSGQYTCVASYRDYPILNATTEIVLSECPPSQFKCPNSSYCIGIDRWCDRRIDCPDNSDEMWNCTQYCPDGFSPCKYSMGQCIADPNQMTCDPFVDCEGGERTRACVSCNHTWLIACNHTDRCIIPFATCDGNNDCGDWEDEINCDCFPDVKCSKTGVCIKHDSVCDGHNDCGDGEDERNTCNIWCSDYYTVMCNSTGDCIYKFKLCDGKNDCGDWEDEKNCGSCNVRSARDPRIQTHFRCDSGECLHYGMLCDGHLDCSDGSDENYCQTVCPLEFTRCNSTTDRRCIPDGYRCDGYLHCDDGEDEEGCEYINPCRYGYVYCNHTERCILLSSLCNGYDDCGDSEDEMNCPPTTCSSYQVACNNTGRCIPLSWLCDGYDDCGDSEDEMNCPPTNCSSYQVACNNTGRCISLSWLCDGDNDCGDSEDEMNCPCKSTEFSCADGTLCRLYTDWCDGYTDCSDGSDEFSNCTTYCPEGLFLCEMRATSRCIPKNNVCDGSWHCRDGADEKDCECPLYAPLKCNSTYRCIANEVLCDGVDNCGDLEDEIGCGPCNQTQFKCEDVDLCQPEVKWCDGNKDCPDGSDEPDDCMKCDIRCAPNQMKCDNKCVRGSQICDGVPDCLDFSDETECICAENQYQCDMGMCIEKTKLCDGFYDCPDASDETNCTTPCADGLFGCSTSNRCISSIGRCNGKINCPDQSDEEGCGPCNKERDWSIIGAADLTDTHRLLQAILKVKDIGYFNVSCAMGMCIPAEWWCNGVVDCPDGSDERNCKSSDETPIVTEWQACPENWFKCADNRKCVPPEYVCDLLSDCDDDSDEGYQCPCPPSDDMMDRILSKVEINAMNKPKKIISWTTMQTTTRSTYWSFPPTYTTFYSMTTTPTYTFPPYTTRPPGVSVNISSWRGCNATGRCILSDFFCDGFENCRDGTDEFGCYGYDECWQGARCDSGQCLSTTDICDAKSDCVDNSDEERCHNSTCAGFLCANGQCVPSSAKCNGRRDCRDWSDEIDCPCNASTQFTCPFSTVCADKVTWCNGVPNCPNSTDETNCTDASSMCYPDQFYCDNKCIDRKSVCDGSVNCIDYSDEINCDCGIRNFKCGMGLCVALGRWCDGTVDCPDATDEPENCAKTCPLGFSWCEKELKCLHPVDICDDENSSWCQADSVQPVVNCSSVSHSEVLCGMPLITPSDVRPFVFGGNEAIPHSWPWTVELQRYGRFICGGSIIHPEWVVTAAHCVDEYDPTSFQVIVGSHRRDSVEEFERKVDVVERVIHPAWNSFLLFNDIALLRLSEPLSYNKHVQPVCIPKVDFPSGKLCTAIGWGDTLGTGDDNVLNQGRLPLLSHELCRYWHRDVNPVIPTMVCAGYVDGRRGACYGDSGGPLVCAKDGKFWLQGLSSWGRPGCQAESAPNVFTRVPSFYSWIATHVPIG